MIRFKHDSLFHWGERVWVFWWFHSALPPHNFKLWYATGNLQIGLCSVWMKNLGPLFPPRLFVHLTLHMGERNAERPCRPICGCWAYWHWHNKIKDNLWLQQVLWCDWLPFFSLLHVPVSVSEKVEVTALLLVINCLKNPTCISQ